MQCAVGVESDEEEAEDALELSSSHFNFDVEEDSDTMSSSERAEAEAAVTTLQLQVRALRKYKSSYELLCGQLGELKAQIGLQLQRHESDVAALQASIAAFQTEKLGLEAQLSEARQALEAQRDAARQDREYSERVHRQLSTAAELLKATEQRLEQQETHFTEQTEQLRTHIAVVEDERAGYEAEAKRLEDECASLRTREEAAKEQETLRRRREKSKHKKELMARAAKLRAISVELEAQRAALRAARKQLAQGQTDNDALRKQLAHVKRDGAHLTEIIDSQRVEHASHADEVLQAKKAKNQFARRVDALSRELEQLQTDLSDAKEGLVNKNNELEDSRGELKRIRAELRQTSQARDDAQGDCEKLTKQVETLQRAAKERRTRATTVEQEQRGSRERKYRKEVLRTRELLVDNQRRATESSKDVQQLRRELLGVQKLLLGRAEDHDAAPGPADQWPASCAAGQKNPCSRAS